MKPGIFFRRIRQITMVILTITHLRIRLLTLSALGECAE
jgi:hypothetical protein